MATGPKPAKSPLEVLTNEGREPPFINQFWAPLICGSIGLTCSLAATFHAKRPVWSGIQRHVLIGVGGVIIGKLVDNYRNDYLAERDAVFRHYIQLHPEDFPDFPQKKYSEVLENWYPLR